MTPRTEELLREIAMGIIEAQQATDEASRAPGLALPARGRYASAARQLEALHREAEQNLHAIRAELVQDLIYGSCVDTDLPARPPSFHDLLRAELRLDREIAAQQRLERVIDELTRVHAARRPALLLYRRGDGMNVLRLALELLAAIAAAPLEDLMRLILRDIRK